MRIQQAQPVNASASSFIPFMPWGLDDWDGTPGRRKWGNPVSPRSPTKPAANILRCCIKTRSALSPTWNACKRFSRTSITSSFRPHLERKMVCSELIFQPAWRTPILQLRTTCGSAQNSAACKGKPPHMDFFRNSRNAETDGRGEKCVPDEASSRRVLLGAAMISTLVGLVTAAGTEFTTPRPALAQSTLTPDAALQELMDGNRRFTGGRPTAHEQDLEILKRNTIEKQEPFAALLSCADSRVPVELVFDQTIGHLFVTRIASNVVTPEIIASLEYGVAVLGTEVILVMGHSNCGAVKATIQAKEVPGEISALFPHIQPAVDLAGTNIEAATKANAKIQAALLREASTVISSFAKQGKVKVAAAYYDITSGAATLLD